MSKHANTKKLGVWYVCELDMAGKQVDVRRNNSFYENMSLGISCIWHFIKLCENTLRQASQLTLKFS